MRKILATVLILLVSLSLIGCSAKKGEKNGPAQREVVIWNAGIQSTDDTNNIKKDDLPLYKTIVDYEEANPDVKVTVVDYSMEDLQKAFTAANLAKSGPDIVVMWAGGSTQAYQDYLVDYRDYLNAEEVQSLGTSSLLFANNDMNGKLLGIPTGMPSTFVMYYNKDIFAANELSVPTNFQELTSVSVVLKEKGITPMALGDKDGYMSTWAISNLIGNLLGPQNLTKLQTGAEKMSGDNFHDSLKAWSDYVNGDFTNIDYLTLNDGDAIKEFLKGNAAMIIHGNWASRDFALLKDSVGVAIIPAISAEAEFAGYMASQPNINLVIPDYSVVKDEAIELVRIFSSSEFNQKSIDTFYSDRTAVRLITDIDNYVAENRTFPGFDSLITGEAASEFYKLVPTYLKGNLSLGAFTEKLDSLNVEK